MEMEIKRVADKMDKDYGLNGKSLPEPDREYTMEAIRIAEISLCSFTGELLSKALAISKAIVEFEDELKKSAQ